MSDKRAFVTGANGFIGKHLVKGLVQEGWHVSVYDRKPVNGESPWHDYCRGDLFDAATLIGALEHAKPSVVFHLAALADVRNALNVPHDQVRLNFEATFALLEAMRATGVNKLVFTSSAVVYGNSEPRLLSERAQSFPQQTSIYGAMKLASESLISAYCCGYGMQADIFRLVSLVGEGYRHGNLMDFYRKLQADPAKIHILGTGREQKHYVYVGDVIDAVLRVISREHVGAELWNVSAEAVSINTSVDLVCEALKLSPAKTYEQTTWTGDLPSLVLDTAKLRATGWQPTVPVVEGIRRTLRDFIERQL